MGCSCTRENALKVVTANKIPSENKENNDDNQSVSMNHHGTTKNPSSHLGKGNTSLNRIGKYHKDHFTLIIIFTEEIRKQLNISLEENKEYIPLSQLLNKALFESDEFDINFTSHYNPNTDDYEYFIERIDEFKGDETPGAFKKYLTRTYENINNTIKNMDIVVENNDDEDLPFKINQTKSTKKNLGTNQELIEKIIRMKSIYSKSSRIENNNNDGYERDNSQKFPGARNNTCINQSEKFGVEKKNNHESKRDSLSNNYFESPNKPLGSTSNSGTHKKPEKKIWNVYINNVLEDFSKLCNENRIIHKDEVLELKCEYF
jgi:hypothetical protein